MKHFFEVFLVALAGIFLVLGVTGAAIFTGMFAVIVWMIPTYKSKTPDQIFAEATGDLNSTVEVIYNFVANPTESFTARLHSYSTKHEALLDTLAEHITEHTSVPISADRLELKSVKIIN